MGFLFLMVVAGNETTTKLLGQRLVLGLAQPGPAGQALRRSCPHPGVDRGDAPLRHVDPDAGPHRRRRTSTLHGVDDPGGRARRRWSSARPTATSACSPTRTCSTSTGPNASCSRSRASGSDATSASARRWPASRPASRSRSSWPACGDYDIDPAGIRRVHSVNVRGFAALPTTVVGTVAGGRHDHHRDRAARAPRVSGDDGGTGHLEELRADPIGLMQRVRAECGDVGKFRLADRDVVLLTGPEANEVFFRAPEEDLDQAEAYPFMTPIFGEGVVFDASPERAARDAPQPGPARQVHARPRGDDRRRGRAAWSPQAPEGGEIDLLDWFAELTIYTSSACLIGKRFREQLDGRFAELYHDLEQGTDAIAYVDPYADIESFRKRDAAARRARRAGARRSWTAAPPSRRPSATTATCSTCSCRSGRGRRAAVQRRHHHRHVHLDDVRRAPHHLGHRGVDAHRAAAPPRRAGRGGRGARRARAPRATR